MLQLRNGTPFQASAALFPDPKGADTLYVMVKATFTIGPQVMIAADQVPVRAADEYCGEPGRSSLAYASEIHPCKPATDVVLVGTAQAKDRRPVDRLDVSLAVGKRRTTIRVWGDRVWTGGVIPPLMTAPEPFRAMPMVYERAYGGVHAVDPEGRQVLSEDRNPVGCGFIGRRGRREIKGLPLPNLEDPRCLLGEPGQRATPSGFGYVAPSWEPRRSRAGTYDADWQASRAPHLPDDFDARFFNAAHPELVYDGYLEGGEPVEILNASVRGPLKFDLPRCDLAVCVRHSGNEIAARLRLETVLIEPDADRLCLLWRASRPCGKAPLKTEWIRLDLLRTDVKREAV
jgi:hypothetical protein